MDETEIRSPFLDEWASNMVLISDDDLRTPGSKHQRKIKEYQDIIKEMAIRATPDNLKRLFSVEPIKCNGGSRFVAHCRYLQHCVKLLKDWAIRKDEGGVKD